ncbi:DUF6193 family natural product biosynthesis protein [Actinoplanes sp. NPDC049596]|uniref:DUF6193 family natural product biosynthesis protein n=1 Tax=unclassified Actinoplanes TaxID=2626549 RepID=UPI003422B45A
MVGVAWQREFDRQGASLEVRRREGVDPSRAARVERDGRRADLVLSSTDGRFYLALRAGETVLLQGFAADLEAAAGAARIWLAGSRPGAAAAAWPFLGSVALAEARERGDRRESAWLWLYENHCANPIGLRLASFLAPAFHEPRLRALRPYTSHWALNFSSTPQWPFTGTFPTVVPAETPGRYVVYTRDRHPQPETDAPESLRLVLSDLPD